MNKETPKNRKHTILNGLHIIEIDGHVHVYTEQEYEHLTWWHKVLIKYNLR